MWPDGVTPTPVYALYSGGSVVACAGRGAALSDSANSTWTYGVHGSTERAVVIITGQVDLLAGRLRGTLIEVADSALNVEIDLSQVTFMDSVGLGALVAGRNVAHANGRTFVVTAMSEPVKRVLQMSGLLEVFTQPADADFDQSRDEQ